MKKFLLSSVALMSAVFVSCDLNASDKTISNKAALETPQGKYGYIIGLDIGKSVKGIEVELDYNMVLQGIKDALDTTKPSLMNDSQVAVAAQEFSAEMRRVNVAKDSIRLEERKRQAAENLMNQNAFFEKNKTEIGVITTESGLQYIVITEGKGIQAKDSDTVTVHYTGTLLDGTKFDSSVERNQPLSVTLSEGQLIPGWVEMLRLMRVGDKIKVWIPSNLGYGESGSHFIQGNSMLVFEMELLEVKPAKK